MNKSVWSTDGMIVTRQIKSTWRKASKNVYHKTQMNWPGIEHGLLWWEAGDYPPDIWHLDLRFWMSECPCS
jgi:hypothetical protein